MTLDEHIWEEEKFVRRFATIANDTRLHDENGELMWKAEQYEKSQHEHEERKSLLEELKTLRVELEKNSKELEVYKKALDMTCYEISASSCDTTESLIEFFIEKAREEELKYVKKKMPALVLENLPEL